MWQTPKTDWTSVDGVTNADMNRIEGNILHIQSNIGRAVFRESGTFVVPENIFVVFVTMCSGGGGGQGGSAEYTDGVIHTNNLKPRAGKGGSSGIWLQRCPVMVTPGQSVSVIVGAGGAGGAAAVFNGSFYGIPAGGAGSNGGTSKFGTLQCIGGLGGENSRGTEASVSPAQLFPSYCSPGGVATSNTTYYGHDQGACEIGGTGGSIFSKPVPGGNGSANGAEGVGFGDGGGGGGGIYFKDVDDNKPATGTKLGGDGAKGASGIVIVEY